MKMILSKIRLVLVIIFLSIAAISEARTCEQPNQCNAFTRDCVRKVEYMTWTQFVDWLTNNNKEYTVLWTSSVNVRFVHEDQCVYQTVCWDSQGECTP